ncbi:sulfurtransferase TusA family protein [Streptomyces sp. NPDC002409]
MLVDRYGRMKIAGDSVALLALALATRAKPQGLVDVSIAIDPAAPLDLPACHHSPGPVPGTEQPVFALRLVADARPTRPDAPWHPDI